MNDLINKVALSKICVCVALFNMISTHKADAQIGRDSPSSNLVENQQATNTFNAKDTIFFDYAKLEKFVQMAVEHNRGSKISEYKSLAAKQDIELAKYNWTNNLMAQFNFNENNASSWGVGPERNDPTTGLPITNNFFPRYQVSLRVPLGVFVLTPMEVKKATHLYKITLEEKENFYRQLTNEVTKKYQNYIIRQKSLLIKLEAETKLHSFYGLVSKNPNTKEIAAMEKEAQVFAAYSQALELRNLAEAELRMAKFDLEQLIGAKIENVK